MFADSLRQNPEGRLLDVGPVCDQNVNFFARQVKRLYLCDLFLRLARDGRRNLPPASLWRHLDYPLRSFDGLLLWDLLDRLPEAEAKRLVDICHNLLRPGGMLLVFALGEGMNLPEVCAFALGADYLVSLRPQPHLSLPVKSIRQNREVLNLLKPFSPVKSFIYRSGFREFLFKRV
jgi:hypothetical protein